MLHPQNFFTYKKIGKSLYLYIKRTTSYFTPHSRWHFLLHSASSFCASGVSNAFYNHSITHKTLWYFFMDFYWWNVLCIQNAKYSTNFLIGGTFIILNIISAQFLFTAFPRENYYDTIFNDGEKRYRTRWRTRTRLVSNSYFLYGLYKYHRSILKK